VAAALIDLDVLAVDCQATAAFPAGHLLELGWARVHRHEIDTHARLVRLPEGARVPPAVARVTGITDAMGRDGVVANVAWHDLAHAASLLQRQPAPAVVHYARFERPFLAALADGPLPLDLVCTHDIARRLLPDLPRRSLRALAGYFGRAVGTLRRSADHVVATAFVWNELLALLADAGVTTWDDLRVWLAAPAPSARARKRAWPMPRAPRLSLPDAPGIYRMLRTNGDILYVGKAASLHHRVNSYFRKQRGIHERTLEMLSQARALSFELAPSALEAALRESDEIKRHRPPYNVALMPIERDAWFATPPLDEHRSGASPRHVVGPFSSPELLERFSALVRGERTALGPARWAPDADTFDAGLAQLHAAHPPRSRADAVHPSSLYLGLGNALVRSGWREPVPDDEPADVAAPRSGPRWTADLVQRSLEELLVRVTRARRRARWLSRMLDVTVTWREPGAELARVLRIGSGDIVHAGDAKTSPGEVSGVAETSPGEVFGGTFTVERFDRLRVLTTELKRLVADGAEVSLQFAGGARLSREQLARALARF